MQINFAKREVQCKVVYYGPAQSGKTASLRCLHGRMAPNVRGQLTTIATDTSRTLYFDFLPLNLGDVAGIRAKVHLYSTPHIDHQNTMRVLVLEGADGIVFVADRTPGCMDRNVEALENLRANLKELGRELDEIPLVFQWNKSDVEGAVDVQELETRLNAGGLPSCAASAEKGQGVLAALKVLSQAILVDVSKLMAMHPTLPARHAPASAPAPTAAPVPAAAAEPEAEGVREPLYIPPWRRGAVPDETATQSRKLRAIQPVADDTDSKIDLDFLVPKAPADRGPPAANIRETARHAPEPAARDKERTSTRSGSALRIPLPPPEPPAREKEQTSTRSGSALRIPLPPPEKAPEVAPEPDLAPELELAPEPDLEMEPELEEAPAPAPKQSSKGRLVRVGGSRPVHRRESRPADDWSNISIEGDEDRHRGGSPPPPRASWQTQRPASAASFAAGALFAIVSLAAIGYVVHLYL